MKRSELVLHTLMFWTQVSLCRYLGRPTHLRKTVNGQQSGCSIGHKYFSILILFDCLGKKRFKFLGHNNHACLGVLFFNNIIFACASTTHSSFRQTTMQDVYTINLHSLVDVPLSIETASRRPKYLEKYSRPTGLTLRVKTELRGRM
jgi:hypothetical protein